MSFVGSALWAHGSFTWPAYELREVVWVELCALWRAAGGWLQQEADSLAPESIEFTVVSEKQVRCKTRLQALSYTTLGCETASAPVCDVANNEHRPRCCICFTSRRCAHDLS